MDGEEKDKIDWFDISVIMVFILGFFGDLSFFLIITHYVCGLIILAILGPKLKGIPPKLLLGAVFILPGPFLMVGSFFAILISNSKLAEVVLEQVAIQGIAIATGGAGEALEGAALAGEAAEGVEAASIAAETGEVAAESAETSGASAESAAEAGPENNRPSEEGDAKKQIEDKAREKLRQRAQDQGQNQNDDENQEDLEDEERKIQQDQDYEREMETGAEIPVMEEVLNKDLPNDIQPVQDIKKPQRVVSIDSGRNKPSGALSAELQRLEKERAVKEQLEKLKPSRQVGTDQSDEDEEDDYLKKAT